MNGSEKRFRISADGVLSPARRVLCANCDRRPESIEPDLIVIHGISLPPGEFGGPYIEALFCNRLDWRAHPYFEQIEGMRVSAHALIRRDGEVVQFVPFSERAWHAGASSFRGRARCNDFSVGLELEGEDETPYEPVQYRVLGRLLRALISRYPAMDVRRIAGHCDISPGRKSDPGPAFDWMRLYDDLAEFRSPVR